MPILDRNEYAAFIEQYGRDIFDHINEVLDSENYLRGFALVGYSVEVPEEVLFRGAKNRPLIGTKLYGLSHNREVSSLDMNYLVEQEPLIHEVTFEQILHEVDFFIDTMENELHGEFRSDLITNFPPLIRHLRAFVAEGIETGQISGALTVEDAEEFVDSHNQMVQAHLQFRERLEDLEITRYSTLEEIQDSKRHNIVQDLQRFDEDTCKVLAAFVYLSSQDERYTREDVARLAGCSRHYVSQHLDWLCEKGFLFRGEGQKYTSTQVNFEGITPQEAYNMLETTPVVDPSTGETSPLAELTWQEALVYAAIQRLGGDSGVLQIGADQLVTEAFRGYYASSGSFTTGILSSLQRRGLLARNTSTSPYTYLYGSVHDEDTILANVRDEDAEQLQSVLELTPISVDVEVEEAPGHVASEVEVSTEEVEEQVRATVRVESFMNSMIRRRLDSLNPNLAQRVIERGQLSVAYDEASGTTQITFSYQEPEEVDDDR